MLIDMTSRTLVVVLVILGVGVLLGSFVHQAYSTSANGYTSSQQARYLPSQQPYLAGVMGGYATGNGGMMGGYGNEYNRMMGQGTVSAGQPVAIQGAIDEMRNVPSYAKVNPSDNTVVFDSQQFSVFVLALMPDRAVNLTGRQLPSYATSDVFVIYGLINPTLVMPAGASVQFTVVNLDDDMYHNLVVSSSGPPFGSMSMQGMMSGDWMPYLPPADYNQGSANESSYGLQLNQSGTFWYLCTYPGHAQSGMYGSIIVTS
jgi:rusticyanin